MIDKTFTIMQKAKRIIQQCEGMQYELT